MKGRSIRLGIFVALCCSMASVAGASESAVRVRVETLLRTLDRSDEDDIAAFARDAFAPESGADLVNELAALADRTRGIAVAGLDVAGNHATVRGRSRLTDEPIALRVRVESSPPYRVTSLAPVRNETADAQPARSRREHQDRRQTRPGRAEQSACPCSRQSILALRQ